MAAGDCILTDLPHFERVAGGTETGFAMEAANVRIPTAKYTKMGETLRYVIPGHMQCSMTCGGKACKYENSSRWSDEEQAIKGLYSSWITDNLLAMARPSTEVIDKYNIIDQFQRCGLRTVINLQRPGEHARCGNPLEQESGFTYRPETFMEAGIFYYNFGWKDYGVASLTTILDMVKVMSFAVQEGKMAVHCHAGLGRTGVLLACYLVFTTRMSADQAILFVRAKRQNSIQTRGQLLCVREFAKFLLPLRSIFSCAEPKAIAVTLSQYLTRQRHLLHGYEARELKNVPKVIQLVCRLLLDIAANRQIMIKEDMLKTPDLTAEVEKTVSQQALQQLGKEMRGKGIPIQLSDPLSPTFPESLPHDRPLASDDFDPLWREQNTPSPLRLSLSNYMRLSLSDSALHKLGARQHLLRTNRLPIHCLLKHSLSHSSVSASTFAALEIFSDIEDTPPLHKRLHREHQNLSLDLTEGRKACSLAPLQALPTKGNPSANKEHPNLDESAHRGVPIISFQSEISLESRCLLVAKALTMDLTDQELPSKVSMWQTELNSREGAWERLCLERDPLVLASLMWSWLEQLKDPVISIEDVKSLSKRNVSPQKALESLEKGHRLTLLCILDCAAHLLPLSEELETSFLNQTIKMFTKMDSASKENESLYSTLKAILAPILHELRDKAVDCEAS